MPTYEYRCNTCQAHQELQRKVDDRDDELLCVCGKNMTRTISAVPIRFNGGGFYSTGGQMRFEVVVSKHSEFGWKWEARRLDERLSNAWDFPWYDKGITWFKWGAKKEADKAIKKYEKHKQKPLKYIVETKDKK